MEFPGNVDGISIIYHRNTGKYEKAFFHRIRKSYLPMMSSMVTGCKFTFPDISRAKRFVLTVGGVLVFSFLLHCILFIIVLSLNLTSAVYMFITLFITEVLMMLIIALQFTIKVIRTAHGTFSSTTNSSSASVHGGGRQSGSISGSVSKE